MFAVKSVRQNFAPPECLLGLLDVFRSMVNDSIRKGLTNDTSSLRGLSLLAYSQLSRYDSPSYYKLCAISRAAGILAARKKSIRRGYASKTPYSVKPQLISCYGFKIENRSSYSSIEKEAFQNTLDQPYPGGYLPNGRHSPFLHAYPSQPESQYRS